MVKIHHNNWAKIGKPVVIVTIKNSTAGYTSTHIPYDNKYITTSCSYEISITDAITGNIINGIRIDWDTKSSARFRLAYKNERKIYNGV